MAAKNADNQVTGTMEDYDFVTVGDGAAEPETKIVFEVMGDSWTGKYLGMRTLGNADGSYQQARFESLDGSNEKYFTNANYSLREGLKSVRIGSIVRMTWTDEMDTGQASPMRIFQTEVARRRSTARTTSSENS
jgi:hypothetical protein